MDVPVCTGREAVNASMTQNVTQNLRDMTHVAQSRQVRVITRVREVAREVVKDLSSVAIDLETDAKILFSIFL
jgi:Flp pilus assembly secretin CpaC